MSDMLMHPSRTENGTMKIREIATSLVFERQPPDARALVASGAFTYADRADRSIRDVLLSAPRATLVELAASAGRAVVHESEPIDSIITFLIPAVEAGFVSLPE